MLAKGTWKWCIFDYLLTNQLVMGLHWFTFKQTTYKGFVVYLQSNCNPLANGFWPLAKMFALLTNRLERACMVICKTKQKCRLLIFSHLLTNQLMIALLWFTFYQTNLKRVTIIFFANKPFKKKIYLDYLADKLIRKVVWFVYVLTN